MILDSWQLPSELEPPAQYVNDIVSRKTSKPPLAVDDVCAFDNVPTGDIAFATLDRHFEKVTLLPRRVLRPIIGHIEERTNLKFTMIRNNTWYPKGGYMGWHTNSNLPGIRAYLIYNDTDGSFFRYKIGEEIVEVREQPGWMIRVFDIPDYTQPLFWHCIGAKTGNRIGIGMLLTHE